MSKTFYEKFKERHAKAGFQDLYAMQTKDPENKSRWKYYNGTDKLPVLSANVKFFSELMLEQKSYGLEARTVRLSSYVDEDATEPVAMAVIKSF
jgi:hypothetical protein